MARRRKGRWKGRLLAAVLLLALAGSAYGWWRAIHWTPDAAQYPVQGVIVGAREGAVDFAGLAAQGAGFAYLEASRGADERDAQFGANFRVASASPLPVGIVHDYDPCSSAEAQSANLVTIVPRDTRLLPPVIALDRLASDCEDPMSEARLESELMTFVNQVEGHVGQPVVLKISPAFEARYGVAKSLERNLWLERDWLEPDYAGRPWTLWTANSQLHGKASEEPIRWVVLQP
ncbi:glycoside hydrolase family 25 protein [Paraurantiacibacter namhicola]|uniref:Lysozyme M1 n=1 Tax=Paraurantiacibacter namhicola TaxID=645517 RepID=A0A1C7D4M3_9SPHN|nr:glycoside hydrolase family 25 protein [Paraurantiacibacter namhicola]ANU06415.1 Lysozyme M1 precursor [Paraurantiacibacter namhicola]